MARVQYWSTLGCGVLLVGLLQFVFPAQTFAGLNAARCFQSDFNRILARGVRQYVNSPERRQALELIQKIKGTVAYPEVPSVEVMSLSKSKPWISSRPNRQVSAGIADPLLERARDLQLFPDFKFISDLQPKRLSASQQLAARSAARRASAGIVNAEDAEKTYLRTFIAKAYEHQEDLLPAPELSRAQWTLKSPDPSLNEAFQYTEASWSKLIRRSRPDFSDSHIPTPYPVLVPGGRFSEHYNWDMYFGVEGALATRRLDLAQMQVENLLSDIQRFGFVPNGGRDYYLTRAQPPLLSSMVRNVFKASLQEAAGNASEIRRLHEWLEKRAMPLLEKEYRNFWMNPKTRYDVKTGLNHHWDDLNLPRPERHGADNELALGKTYRDVRAAAESGLDFTDVFKGESSQMGSVLLNSVLGKVEGDLAWMAGVLKKPEKAREYGAALLRRRKAMDTYLWDPLKGRYENYNLRTGERVGVVSADTFTPLFAGVASSEQAARVRDSLKLLERRGGVMASELTESFHQWDGANGWAPFQYFAIEGLRKYGFSDDSQRLARKWVNALATTYKKEGSMFERINLDRIAKPALDGKKYDPQPDFLWSIGTFDWAVVNVLGQKLHKLSP